jgi:hypothetical protein
MRKSVLSLTIFGVLALEGSQASAASPQKAPVVMQHEDAISVVCESVSPSGAIPLQDSNGSNAVQVAFRIKNSTDTNLTVPWQISKLAGLSGGQTVVKSGTLHLTKRDSKLVRADFPVRVFYYMNADPAGTIAETKRDNNKATAGCSHQTPSGDGEDSRFYWCKCR